ncbi:flagellar biosynthesis regulator FlaF [Falsiroseomonas stagni]|uniref:Protein FlaF n=1 Tax=Falsiroseomonas stagni DSM 19981 TaxID=1123062 RepID=A0A1I3X8R8_9PROT|nr:flagellar biosynthesis regulator FlaF [Falsiroseomonas stagni]SFK16008.1 protein FlaF [Falsiroseomonas stagni DSM 19981]
MLSEAQDVPRTHAALAFRAYGVAKSGRSQREQEAEVFAILAARLRAAIRDPAPMATIRAAADAHRVFVTVESIVLDPVSTLPRDLRLNIASVARRAVKEANSDKPDLDFLAAIAEDFAAGLGARLRTDR